MGQFLSPFVPTTYEYDSRNNLISETRTDGYTKTYEYSGDNRLVKTVENGVETAYEYDLRGNLVKRGEDEFAYDSNDNLVYAKVNGVETTYEIGEDGLRKSKTVNGVTTTYSVDDDKRGRTFFVNIWLQNRKTSDTIQIRGDKNGKESTRDQRKWIVSHCFSRNK